MKNRVVTMTVLVIASILASPVVVADDTQDIPTNAQNTGAHDSLVAAPVSYTHLRAHET